MRLTLPNSNSDTLIFLSLDLNLFFLQISIKSDGEKHFDIGH